MKIEYDPILVDQATYLAARGDSLTERKLRSEIDPLYLIEDGDRREAEFRKVFSEHFVALGLDRVLLELLAERPTISEGVGTCIVREAARARAQSAELFVRGGSAEIGPDSRTLMVQLCPTSLVEPDAVRPLMRRELLHVADMLDESFDYAPEDIEGIPATRNLIRDRYRVLWDTYVESRLLRDSRVSGRRLELLRRNFQRAFTTGGRTPASTVFDQISGMTALTHTQMLQWAREPEALEGNAASDETESSQSRQPGATCPICRFPTYDWYGQFAADEDSVEGRIRDEHPNWQPEHGLCRRCAEAYAVLSCDR